MTLTQEYLGCVSTRLARRDYPKSRWIEFCERMLAEGYTVDLREAHSTVSKYVTVWNLGRKFTARFSNHGATRQDNDPVDFFVGVNSFGTTTTEQAIEAAITKLGKSPFAVKETA